MTGLEETPWIEIAALHALKPKRGPRRNSIVTMAALSSVLTTAELNAGYQIVPGVISRMTRGRPPLSEAEIVAKYRKAHPLSTRADEDIVTARLLDRVLWRKHRQRRISNETPEERAQRKAKVNESTKRRSNTADGKIRRTINRKRWRNSNPDLHAAIQSRQRAKRERGIPAWVRLEDLIPFYAEARTRSEQEGYKFHVDHIAPLAGRKCSGLHVPWNLRVIPGGENMAKNNKLDPSLLISLEERQAIKFEI